MSHRSGFHLKPLAFIVLQAFALSAYAAPITLSGDYINIGTNDQTGTLGSGGNTSPGIRFDPAGSGTFTGADYLTPGSPMNGFGISSNLGLQSRNNDSGMDDANNWAVDSFTDYSGAAFGGSTLDKRVVWSGTYNNGGNGYTIKHDIGFNNSDKWITVKTTITATSNLTALKFAKFTDPDVVAGPGDTSSTINERGASLGGVTISGNDLVKATANSGYVIGYYTSSTTTHNTAASAGWSTDPNTYTSGSGDTTGDDVVGLGFDIGTLNAGDSVTLVYYYLFGTDLADLINSLNSSGGGGTPSKLATLASPVGTGAAKVLDSLNGGGDTNAQLQAIIDELNTMTDAQITRGLKKLSPATNRAMDVSTRQAMTANFDAVRIRLDNLRLHRGDYRASEKPILVAFNGNPVGLLERDKQYGAWTKAVGTRSTQSSSGNFDGYRSDTAGVMVGGDMLLENKWLVGAALAYGATDVDYRDVTDDSDTKVDNYQATAYASKWLGKSYIDLMFAYAYHRFDSNRDTGLAGIAQAKYDGTHIGVKGVWGFPIALDRHTELTPMVGLSVSRLRTDSYTEKGAGAASLHVDDSSATRVRSSLGAELQRTLYVGTEALRPSVELSWLHDFRTEGIDTSASFTGGGAAFETPGQELERDALGVGAGIGWQMSRDAVLSVKYNGEFTSGFRSHQAELTAVWTF